VVELDGHVPSLGAAARQWERGDRLRHTIPGVTANNEAALAVARALREGTTAVVTGAGSGLGSGFAEVAGELGMRVVLCDIDGRRVQAEAARLAGGGADVRGVVVDVRDFTAVKTLADEVCGAGDVGLVVNNAGVEHLGLLWEVPLEDWHRVIDINLNGVYHGVRAFVPRLIAQQRRSVVLNISSVGALTTGAYHGTYEVTKHGVLALSEALADGLAMIGAPVQVSVALPGPVRTRIYADANAEAPGPDAFGGRLGSMRDLVADQGLAPPDAARSLLGQVAGGAFVVTTHLDWMRPLAAQRARRLLELTGAEL
jgi:NAD(P)-dependent dehydrogenase (short-subunit alcohol dehydrogenase family)